MPRILFVGQEPETVDFSDPALPPGFSAEKIHSGIAVATRQMTERGWQADLCLVRPDDTAAPAVERQPARPSRQLSRFDHSINPDGVFGTHKQRKPALCHRTSVSGRMIVRTFTIDGNQRYSWIKNQRSLFVSRTRPCILRRKTIN